MFAECQHKVQCPRSGDFEQIRLLRRLSGHQLQTQRLRHTTTAQPTAASEYLILGIHNENMELLAFFLTNRGSQDGTYRASFAHRCRRFLSARAPRPHKLDPAHKQVKWSVTPFSICRISLRCPLNSTTTFSNHCCYPSQADVLNHEQ